MAITLNASTQSGLVVSPDQSGVLQLQTGGTPGITVQTSSVQLLTNGIASLTVDSSQRVGIGTTSPTSPLQVNTSGVNTTVQINSTDANGGYGAVFSLNNTGTGGRQYGLFSTSNADGDVGGGKLKFYDFTAGATRMLIDSSGNLLVGQTTTVLTGTIQFTYDGSSRQGMCIKNSANSQNGAAIRFIDYTNAYTGGGIYYTSSNSISYATSSDYRLKENIAPMTGALAKVEQLKPVTFNWKQDNSASQGFIAHELQDIIPEAVIGTKDSVDADGKPMYQGVDTSYIVATLTAAIKELKAELDTVKSELATLKGQA